MDTRPTEKLLIQNPEEWAAEARAFAESLIAKGQRPWFEVRYVAPEYITDPTAIEEWNRAQEQTFDVLELVDGEFGTAPTYAEMEAWA